MPALVQGPMPLGGALGPAIRPAPGPLAQTPPPMASHNVIPPGQMLGRPLVAGPLPAENFNLPKAPPFGYGR